MEMGILQDTGVNPLNTITFTGKLESSAVGMMRNSKCIRPKIFNGVL